jgi:hypothetical protein
VTAPSGHSEHGLAWHRFSIVEQLANVGSEVDRAVRAHASGNVARFNQAVDRALFLIDQTATDPRWPLHQRREVLRAREEFCRLGFGDGPSAAEDAASLQRYLLAFGVLARRGVATGV